LLSSIQLKPPTEEGQRQRQQLTALPASASLTSHPGLTRFGYKADRERGHLVCLRCSSVVKISGVQSHHQRRHSEDTEAPTESRVKAAVAELGMDWDSPVCPVPPGYSGPPLPGLPIHAGLRCLDCSFCCVSEDWMSKHLAAAVHRGSCPALVQQLRKAQRHSAFFSVHAVVAVEPPSAGGGGEEEREMAEAAAFAQGLSAGLRRGDSATRAAAYPTDMRQLTPFLLQTRWHDHVRGHDPRALVDLVAAPAGRDDWHGLGAAVERYLRTATEYLPALSDWTLRGLNSPRPKHK
jgi:hypothetical protein